MTHPFPYDQNYVVQNLPPSVKGKITLVIQAAMDYSFIGAAHPDDFEAIEEALHVARYDLERTIQTVLNRK
jgi:hypothetical protein